MRNHGLANEPAQPLHDRSLLMETLVDYDASQENMVTKLAQFHIEISGFIDGNVMNGQGLLVIWS